LPSEITSTFYFPNERPPSRARDQQLGIAVSAEDVASNVTEPPLNFNSGRDNRLNSTVLEGERDMIALATHGHFRGPTG
jgi:hypothetical protein